MLKDKSLGLVFQIIELKDIFSEADLSCVMKCMEYLKRWSSGELENGPATEAETRHQQSCMENFVLQNVCRLSQISFIWSSVLNEKFDKLNISTDLAKIVSVAFRENLICLKNMVCILLDCTRCRAEKCWQLNPVSRKNDANELTDAVLFHSAEHHNTHVTAEVMGLLPETQYTVNVSTPQGDCESCPSCDTSQSAPQSSTPFTKYIHQEHMHNVDLDNSHEILSTDALPAYHAVQADMSEDNIDGSQIIYFLNDDQTCTMMRSTAENWPDVGMSDEIECWPTGHLQQDTEDCYVFALERAVKTNKCEMPEIIVSSDCYNCTGNLSSDCGDDGEHDTQNGSIASMCQIKNVEIGRSVSKETSLLTGTDSTIYTHVNVCQSLAIDTVPYDERNCSKSLLSPLSFPKVAISDLENCSDLIMVNDAVNNILEFSHGILSCDHGNVLVDQSSSSMLNAEDKLPELSIVKGLSSRHETDDSVSLYAVESAPSVHETFDDIAGACAGSKHWCSDPVLIDQSLCNSGSNFDNQILLDDVVEVETDGVIEVGNSELVGDLYDDIILDNSVESLCHPTLKPEQDVVWNCVPMSKETAYNQGEYSLVNDGEFTTRGCFIDNSVLYCLHVCLLYASENIAFQS